MKQATTLFCLIITFLFCSHFSAHANNAAYEARRQAYMDSALVNLNNDALMIQAYKGVPLDTTRLYTILNEISTGVTSDFDITKLIRILFLTSPTGGAYDAKILPVLNSVPYWINKGDTVRNYWSENHMIMWMSADWLLHEKYGKAIDPDLETRLRHYLDLKVKYGFYEFFSSVYAPYCLSGLINLADYATDPQIKAMAAQASSILLKDILLLTNDKGIFYPTAGRNYMGKYTSAYGQNHNHLIYLLTGMGPAPNQSSQGGGFLTTSNLPIDSIAFSWKLNVDTSYYIGHTLDSGFVINSGVSPLDRTIFQWSSGAYFHPQVVLETGHLLGDSALWRHVDFAPFRQLSGLPINDFPAFSNYLSAASKSSLLCGEQVVIFKHQSISLSSVQDFSKGKVGYQQFPCVANVGITPVFTAAGPVKKDWETRSANNASEHLPYVAQKKNVALLMYRPEPTPAPLPFKNPEVALFFRESDYDEVKNDSMWLIGRQNNNYVAVRRSCLGYMDSVRACPMSGGQTWVIVVGDSSLSGGFTNFQNSIHQSQFEEKWYIDTTKSPIQKVYYAKVKVDTTTIDYAWGVDSINTSGIENIRAINKLKLYPNPTTNNVTIQVEEFMNEPFTIRVVNILGKEIYSETIEQSSSSSKIISTNGWPEGAYSFSIYASQKTYTGRLMKIE